MNIYFPTAPAHRHVSSTNNRLLTGLCIAENDKLSNTNTKVYLNKRFTVTFCLTYKRALDSRTRATTRMRFFHRTALSVHKSASFWRENRHTVVILVRGFVKMLWCQNNSRTRSKFWYFSISKKARLPATITEQSILVTKSKINRPSYKFSKYFRYKRALKSPTPSRSRPRPGI